MNILKLLFLCGLLAISFVAQAETVGTAFTYQGELKQLNAPATGSYDFQFGLFDSESNGDSVATAIQIENVVVSSGSFTVELDFGSSPFNGDQRWLELSVRDGASVGPHVVLSPRQVINPTPYAVRALKVFDRVVVVSGAHTPIENGTAALDAVTFIQSQGPSEINPWLIQLEPGTFDIGSQSLNLPDYVSLAGSGMLSTLLKSATNSIESPHTLGACSYCSISNVSIENTPSHQLGNSIYGVDKRQLHISYVDVHLNTNVSGGTDSAISLSTLGGLIIENSQIGAFKDADIGEAIGLRLTAGTTLIILKNISVSVEGTNNVHATAFLVAGGAHLEANDISLVAISDTVGSLPLFEAGTSIGLLVWPGAALFGRVNGLIVDSSSNNYAVGVWLYNVHSTMFSGLNVVTDAPVSRAFVLENYNADEIVEAITIRDSTVRATGNTSIGMVFIQRPDNSTNVGLTLINTDVTAICDSDQICYSLSAYNEGNNLSVLDVFDSRFTCINDINPDTAQGIFTHGLKATFQNSISTAFWSPLLIDYNAPALASDILFQGGSLNATTTAIYAGGTSSVSVQSAIINGGVALQGSATTTCVASVVNDIFKADGC